jgi:hypothetical protein
VFANDPARTASATLCRRTVAAVGAALESDAVAEASRTATADLFVLLPYDVRSCHRSGRGGAGAILIHPARNPVPRVARAGVQTLHDTSIKEDSWNSNIKNNGGGACRGGPWPVSPWRR